MFCQEVIHSDLEHVKRTPCRNAYLGSYRDEGFTLDQGDLIGEKGRIEKVFGEAFWVVS